MKPLPSVDGERYNVPTIGALRTWPSWPAGGSAAGPAAAAARGSDAAGLATATGPCEMLTLPPFTILTFSSPSVISSSAMPDSCTRSISFFSFRRSMVCPSQAAPVGFGARYRSALAPSLVVGLRRPVERELQREVVAAAPETAD